MKLNRAPSVAVLSFAWAWLAAASPALVRGPSPSPLAEPRPIAEVLKASVLKGVLEHREVATHAELDRPRYAFHTSFLARAPLARTKARLTDFEAYERLVPYVDEARYDNASHILKLRGSIWKYGVSTEIRFTERGERWLGFEMVGGHFKGMTGEMVFEPHGEKGTLVLVRGEQIARDFPPAFILEQGAKIVFGVTSKRMRSYVESEDTGATPHDKQIPRPRRRL